VRSKVVWRLAGFVDVTTCEIVETPNGVAVGLRMGDELILAELLPGVEEATIRARGLRAKLSARGWVPFGS
jgi:hypothetical protein